MKDQRHDCRKPASEKSICQAIYKNALTAFSTAGIYEQNSAALPSPKDRQDRMIKKYCRTAVRGKNNFSWPVRPDMSP